MKERHIIFNGEMVRATLDGRKTQTRQVIKPQPMTWGGRQCMPFLRDCPYGIGDHLWVRETWLHECPHCDDSRCGNPDHIWYKAAEANPDMFPRWKPSIHMPRWASRITLEITGIRVEQVQDICDADIKAEGAPLPHTVDGGVRYQCSQPHNHSTLRGWWWCQWNSINDKRGFGWDVNPWCWCITWLGGER